MLTVRTEKLSFGNITVEPYDQDDDNCITVTFDLNKGVKVMIICIHQYSIDQLRRFFGSHSRGNGVMEFMKIYTEPPDTEKEPLFMYVEILTDLGKLFCKFKSSDDTLEVSFPVRKDDLSKLEKMLAPD